LLGFPPSEQLSVMKLKHPRSSRGLFRDIDLPNPPDVLSSNTAECQPVIQKFLQWLK